MRTSSRHFVAHWSGWACVPLQADHRNAFAPASAVPILAVMTVVSALFPMGPWTPTAVAEFSTGSGNLVPSTHSGPPGAQGGPNATFCSSLISNASLNTSVSATYAELGNLSSPGSSNQSGIPGHSSAPGLVDYPSEANASLLVRSWWASVCVAPVFVALTQQWGTANFSWSFDVGSVGASWQFVVGWTAGCTIPNVGTFSGCQYAEFWTGNLKNQSLGGPTTTASPPCGTLTCPIYVVGAGARPPPNTTPWSTASTVLRAYWWVVGAIATAFAIGLLAARTFPIDAAPPSPRGPTKTEAKERPGELARPDPLDDVI